MASRDRRCGARGATCRRPSAARPCACSARSCAATRTSSARWCRSRTARSWPRAIGEVQEMIDIADFAVGQSRMLYGLTMHSERPQHRMYEQWHPLGVVGVISAFNFPVAVWSWNAFLAAICGNACVWKPSPKTPLSALAVQQLCNRVMERHELPPIFQLFIDAGTELATRFVEDRRVALVSFTGSTEVGRQVGERVAARLGKSLLELGGNNAIIVDESAEPGSGGAGDRVRRGRHRRPALHQHAPRARASRRSPRSSSGAWCTPTGRCASAIRSTDGTLMGPLIDAARRRSATRPRCVAARSRRRRAPLRRQGAARARATSSSRPSCARTQRLADRADAKPSRRFCT